MSKEEIFIPINVPSSKNSKQFVYNYKSQRGFLVNSNLTQQYIQKTTPLWMNYRQRFKQIIGNKKKPLIIGFHLVRKTRQRFDFINSCQILQDLLVKHGIIPDDNMSEMFPVPFKKNGNWYSIDGKNPGVYIRVFEEIHKMYE